MSDKIKHQKGKESVQRNKRFYVALGICLIAIGVTSITTYSSVKKFMQQDIVAPITETDKPIKKETNQENTHKTTKQITQQVEPEPKKSNQQNTLDIEEAAIETEGSASGVMVYPVGQNVVKAYSDNNPVYSTTFKDWRIHNGIDFAAEKGEKVKSITKGEVKEIFDDPLMGTTVVIEHDGGLVAIYSGLDPNVTVKVGDKVEPGTDIGSVGVIPGESNDGSHLHLSIKRDGKFINPGDILGTV